MLAQGIVVGIMLLTGILLGFWLDLFRFINRRGRLFYFPLLDLLFWAVVTCVVFAVLISTNYLQLRMYVFLSLALGLLIYLKILSRHILHLYARGFEIILKMIKWVGWILKPLTIPLRTACGLLDAGSEAVLTLIARLVLGVFQRSRQDNHPVA